MAATLKILYSFANPNKRGKERFETILEPLQAIIQIGFISFYPVGAKLAIKHNMLIIQPPNYTQSVSRWYHNDTQDDLCYLFNVFSRFNRFYSYMETTNSALYVLLVTNARAGIDKLIRTYSDTNKPHILHTLSMYKTMIGAGPSCAVPDPYLETFSSGSAAPAPAPANTGAGGGNSNQKKGVPTPVQSTELINIVTPPVSTEPTSNIDTIFGQIVDKYNSQIFVIIHNVLLQLNKRDDIVSGSGDNYLHYINGLNQILYPINVSIKKWIDENIVF